MNEEAEKLYERLRREAEEGGYLLNPDRQFVLELMEGLVANQKRYGYLACPCRLADGERGADLDIICPCDYRDPDLAEFGTCYCGLYVSEEVASGKKPLESIPDRRPPPEERKAQAGGDEKRPSISGSLPVWRCRVCGYLCAREQPPLKCPICKADRDRFERFS